MDTLRAITLALAAFAPSAVAQTGQLDRPVPVARDVQQVSGATLCYDISSADLVILRLEVGPNPTTVMSLPGDLPGALTYGIDASAVLAATCNSTGSTCYLSAFSVDPSGGSVEATPLGSASVTGRDFMSLGWDPDSNTLLAIDASNNELVVGTWDGAGLFGSWAVALDTSSGAPFLGTRDIWEIVSVESSPAFRVQQTGAGGQSFDVQDTGSGWVFEEATEYESVEVIVLGSADTFGGVDVLGPPGGFTVVDAQGRVAATGTVPPSGHTSVFSGSPLLLGAPHFVEHASLPDKHRPSFVPFDRIGDRRPVSGASLLEFRHTTGRNYVGSTDLEWYFHMENSSTEERTVNTWMLVSLAASNESFAYSDIGGGAVLLDNPLVVVGPIIHVMGPANDGAEIRMGEGFETIPLLVPNNPDLVGVRVATQLVHWNDLDEFGVSEIVATQLRSSFDVALGRQDSPAPLPPLEDQQCACHGWMHECTADEASAYVVLKNALTGN